MNNFKNQTQNFDQMPFYPESLNFYSQQKSANSTNSTEQSSIFNLLGKQNGNILSGLLNGNESDIFSALLSSNLLGNNNQNSNLLESLSKILSSSRNTSKTKEIEKSVDDDNFEEI